MRCFWRKKSARGSTETAAVEGLLENPSPTRRGEYYQSLPALERTIHPINKERSTTKRFTSLSKRKNLRAAQPQSILHDEFPLSSSHDTTEQLSTPATMPPTPSKSEEEEAIQISGGTDIWTACKVGNLAYVQQTVRTFPELLHMELQGRTPLYHACHCGYAPIVLVLLKAGCMDDASGTCYQSALNQECRTLIKQYKKVDKKLNGTADSKLPFNDSIRNDTSIAWSESNNASSNCRVDCNSAPETNLCASESPRTNGIASLPKAVRLFQDTNNFGTNDYDDAKIITTSSSTCAFGAARETLTAEISPQTPSQEVSKVNDKFDKDTRKFCLFTHAALIKTQAKKTSALAKCDQDDTVEGVVEPFSRDATPDHGIEVSMCKHSFKSQTIKAPHPTNMTSEPQSLSSQVAAVPAAFENEDVLQTTKISQSSDLVGKKNFLSGVGIRGIEDNFAPRAPTTLELPSKAKSIASDRNIRSLFVSMKKARPCVSANAESLLEANRNVSTRASIQPLTQLAPPNVARFTFDKNKRFVFTSTKKPSSSVTASVDSFVDAEASHDTSIKDSSPARSSTISSDVTSSVASDNSKKKMFAGTRKACSSVAASVDSLVEDEVMCAATDAFDVTGVVAAAGAALGVAVAAEKVAETTTKAEKKNLRNAEEAKEIAAIISSTRNELKFTSAVEDSVEVTLEAFGLLSKFESVKVSGGQQHDIASLLQPAQESMYKKAGVVVSPVSEAGTATISDQRNFNISKNDLNDLRENVNLESAESNETSDSVEVDDGKNNTSLMRSESDETSYSGYTDTSNAFSFTASDYASYDEESTDETESSDSIVTDDKMLVMNNASNVVSGVVDERDLSGVTDENDLSGLVDERDLSGIDEELSAGAALAQTASNLFFNAPNSMGIIQEEVWSMFTGSDDHFNTCSSG